MIQVFVLRKKEALNYPFHTLSYNVALTVPFLFHIYRQTDWTHLIRHASQQEVRNLTVSHTGGGEITTSVGSSSHGEKSQVSLQILVCLNMLN